MTQSTMTDSAAPGVSLRVHRVEVRPRPGTGDPKGASALREVRTLGLPAPQRIDTAAVYLIAGALTDDQVQRIANELLADPVVEIAHIGASPTDDAALIEVHPLPGVMDPDAQAVELAIFAMLGVNVQVRTGQRYDLHGVDQSAARTIAERAFANAVIHAIHDQPHHPDAFAVSATHDATVREVALCDLDDAALTRLSREAHLFLSIEEMRAIQAEYRRLGREPREIELETLAQTWSEHCVHKTLKSTVVYSELDGTTDDQRPRMAIRGRSALDLRGRPGHTVNEDGSITIHNLLKSTIAAATHELMNEGIDWCLGVFVDNAGVIAFDDDHAVCFKVETHNHPSAIEPYGGAATGIGGCIRDVIGTGLAAKPIAATDIFCVAHPDRWRRGEGDATSDTSTVKPLPEGCLHPRRILSQVVAGVRDYGNRMGIPTLNGTVWFDNDYVGNPLVYCGCVGVMPRDRVHGGPQPGDHIIALGGRTGRDGIHGATFSSAELTDTHADEFSHAVQIGNAVTEKKLLDAILAARDHEFGCLFNAITDCGAGGFSSAVGEMGEALGATVQLERAPLKYDGLSPTEIWISEAQERMVLAVPSEHLETLRDICEQHDVELCDLGTFGTPDRELVLRFGDTEVGRMSMQFLHEGLPETTREATWTAPVRTSLTSDAPPSAREALLKLLAHPNIASKHWIVRQYDHEVQGGTVIKPLVGERGEGPGDAAVIAPVADSTRGIGIANGLATGLRDDPYLMTLAAIDECVRNLVCVGVDPARIAILDNFCWPSCRDPLNLGALVRAAEACYDGAKAYRTPFISGKDSLNNQFTTEDGRTIQVPPTLLISGFGIVPDVHRCVTMDAKRAGDLLLLVGETTAAMGGSHYTMMFGAHDLDAALPMTDLDLGPRTARSVAACISDGLVRTAHDCSEGGMLIAAAEMALAGGLGLEIDTALIAGVRDLPITALLFAETPSRYLLEVSRDDLDAIDQHLRDVPYAIIGEFNDGDRLTVAREDVECTIAQLRDAWRGTLDW